MANSPHHASISGLIPTREGMTSILARRLYDGVSAASSEEMQAAYTRPRRSGGTGDFFAPAIRSWRIAEVLSRYVELPAGDGHWTVLGVLLAECGDEVSQPIVPMVVGPNGGGFHRRLEHHRIRQLETTPPQDWLLDFMRRLATSLSDWISVEDVNVRAIAQDAEALWHVCGAWIPNWRPLPEPDLGRLALAIHDMKREC